MAYGDDLYHECHSYDLDGNPLAETRAPMFAIADEDGRIICRLYTWADADAICPRGPIFKYSIINLEFDADDPSYWIENPRALA